MRKIRNIRKDDAVSPVIATILMVAITVVLAAVLYVMVMGMTGTSTTSASGNWSAMEKLDSTHAKLTFGKFTKDVSWTDIKVIVTGPSGADSVITFSDNTPTATVSGGNVSAVSASDLASNDVINSGDSLTLTIDGTTGVFTVKVLDVQTGDVISMVGTTTFTM